MPTENDLIMNPITGKMNIGKNVDSYEEFINSHKGKSAFTKDDVFYNRLSNYAKEAMKKGNKILNFSQTPDSGTLLSFNRSEDRAPKGKKKIFLGGRIIDNNYNFHPEQDSDRLACFDTMGQYDSSDRKGKANNFKNFIKRLKENKPKKQLIQVDKDDFTSGHGTLKNNDIQGSSPAKFQRGRKLFVDRNSIKTVLGQSPGKYHGFAHDYTQGGTYASDVNQNIIISDFSNYSKKKVANLNYDVKDKEEGSFPHILTRSNLSSEYLLNRSLNTGKFPNENEVYSNLSSKNRMHPQLSINNGGFRYGREKRDMHLSKSLATNDRHISMANAENKKLSKDLDQGAYSQDRLQNHFASRNASKTDGEGYQYPTMERQGKNQINLAQRSEVLRTGPDRNGYNYSNERSFDDRGQKSYHNLKQNLDNSASNHRVGGKKLFSQNLKNLNYIDYLKQFK
ncbi:unnamed protein product [Moneuplotes crassus]|uniref:Uncharacterized protein n=1 Tax=Euplotes crassus TaxID=5936 RepID=A0AAD1U9P7_EUPCR|nr:unnamed protein product [Moneuplotes crassus]